jgi:GTPase
MLHRGRWLGHKFLSVSLLGAPNSGKSSFINAFVKSHIAAVSAKSHTTRESIIGVLTLKTTPDCWTQIEIKDFPGVIPVKQSQELREMAMAAWDEAPNSDILCVVIDAVKTIDVSVIRMLRKLKIMKDKGKVNASKLALLLTKIDLVDPDSSSSYLHKKSTRLAEHLPFDRVFFTSSKRNRGLEAFTKYCESQAQESPSSETLEVAPLKYPIDCKTTLSKEQLLEQTVRNFIYTWFNKDLPYKIDMRLIRWTENLTNPVNYIEYELHVADSVVARMVRGVRNRLLQQLTMNINDYLPKLIGSSVDFKCKVIPKKQRQSKKDKEQILKKQFKMNYGISI